MTSAHLPMARSNSSEGTGGQPPPDHSFGDEPTPSLRPPSASPSAGFWDESTPNQDPPGSAPAGSFGDEPTPSLRPPHRAPAGPVFPADPTPGLGPKGPARKTPHMVEDGSEADRPRPPRRGTLIQYTPPAPPDPSPVRASVLTPLPGEAHGLKIQGPRFGRYVLTGLLAEGGMARVYHALLRDESGFEKPLAIKCMHQQLSQDPTFVSRFVDEARIASTLSHSNIVQVFDFGKGEKGRYFLAMELVQGPDLGTLLDRLEKAGRPMPIPAALYVGAGALRGLGAAHLRIGAEGAPAPVVHRDMSPQNILLSLTGEVKVADFGIAKAASNLVQTRAGTVMGKFFYMSPEQCLGQSVDPRSDIFSTGCVLFEMLTGRALWSGASPDEVMQQVIQAPIPNVLQVNPSVPAELGQILARSLNRDPAVRFADGNAMARALERLLHRLAPGYSRDDLSDLVGEMHEGPGGEGKASPNPALWAMQGDESPSLDELRRQGAGQEQPPSPTNPADEAGASGVEIARPETEIHPLEDSAELSPRLPAADAPAAGPAPRRPLALILAAALLLGAVSGSAAAWPNSGEAKVRLSSGKPVTWGPWELTLKSAEARMAAGGPRLLLELWARHRQGKQASAGRLFQRQGKPALFWITATVQKETILRLVFAGGKGPVRFAPPDAEPIVFHLQ